jgi:hypothetical protein
MKKTFHRHLEFSCHFEFLSLETFFLFFPAQSLQENFYLSSLTEVDWDQKASATDGKASATFHTKNPKGSQNSSKMPLRPKSHCHYGQSAPVY